METKKSTRISRQNARHAALVKYIKGNVDICPKDPIPPVLVSPTCMAAPAFKKLCQVIKANTAKLINKTILLIMA